jgi:hypothetical protein
MLAENGTADYVDRLLVVVIWVMVFVALALKLYGDDRDL